MSDLSGIDEAMRRGPGRPRKDARAPQRSAQRAPSIPWRARRGDADITGDDQFYVPPEIIPPGMDWQWKRYSYLGKDDISYQRRLERDGAWDPVPHSAWPEKMGKWGHADEPIILDGQILMQRPMELTIQALAEEKSKATSRVTTHFQSLGLGEGPVPMAKPSIKVDYGTMLVPDDDVPDLE